MEPQTKDSKLIEEITCGVCIDVYKDPVLLQCFCRKCIEDVERRATGQSINCPLCRVGNALIALCSFLQTEVVIGKGIPNAALRNIAEQNKRHEKMKDADSEEPELQPQDIESFVAKQLALLEVEQQAESKEVKDENLSEMVTRGAALLRLRLDDTTIGLGGRALVRLCGNTPSLAAHRFQPGDIVALRPCDVSVSMQQQEDNRSGVVFSVEDGAITVALPVLDLPSAGPFNLLMLTNDITYRRLRTALERLRQCAERAETTKVTDVLFGRATPAVAPTETFEPLNVGLNEPQRAAISFALACNEVALLHGPPGTGKTTTVVELILQAVRRGARVLACAPSNIAVDNMVERLAQYPKTRILRLGHPARLLPSVLSRSLDVLVQQAEGTKLVNDVKKEIKDATQKLSKAKSGGERRELIGELKLLRKEIRKREKDTLKALVKDSQVVLATITGCDDKLLKDDNSFDLVVIDEAAQALEAACWIAIPKGKRLVLAGDHRQLPPTLHSEEAARSGLAVTLFDRLMATHGRKLSRMLTIQYRMHTAIMNFSSRELYASRLVAHDSVASHLLCDLSHVKRTEDTSVPLLFIDTAGCNVGEDVGREGASKSNEGEVEIVKTYVQRLRDAGVGAKEISVLTPYNAQVDKLRLRLLPLHPGLEIGTVDGMQGREREAVVLSLVRSNGKREVGFLADDRRLNVGLTRARRHLCVVADSDTVSSHPFLAKLVQYCEANGEYNGADAYLPEDRPFYGAAQDGAPAASKGATARTLKKKKTTSTTTTAAGGSSVAASTTGGKSEKGGAPAKPKTAVEEAEDERAYQAIKAQVVAFAASTSPQELAFPATLTSYERMLVHKAAEELGMPHGSRGDGEARQVTVRRVPPKAAPLVAPKEEAYVGPAKEKTKKQAAAAKAAAEAASERPAPPAAAAVAKHSVSQLPIEEIEEGDDAEKEDTGTAQPQSTGKGKKKKKKKPAAASKLPETEEDIDALLASYKTNACYATGCKQGVEILGRICNFCRMKYCYNHALPEVHGCGEEAKKHARAEAAEAPKPKPMKEEKRAVLQRALDKKIDQAVEGRSRKPPARKK